MLNKIKVLGIKTHSFHGCLPHERLTGTTFNTNVIVEHDFERAAKFDDLELTLDYCSIAAIVQSEMSIPANLIEQVGYRIFNRIKAELKPTGAVTVEIEKWNAPIQGEVDKVVVEISG